MAVPKTVRGNHLGRSPNKRAGASYACSKASGAPEFAGSVGRFASALSDE
ncbi:MAG TPA: hypothetical protein PKE04_04710 [Clostridia bacterium]|nr:hypothetical protein [Clostridia bacterium]